MKFCKMNGAGNDFIIVNNMDGAYSSCQWPTVVKHLCERHMSIGADGFMVVEKALGDADFRMVFFNSDGSEGEMCGNGARCICRYGYENGLAGEIQRVETAAGLVIGERINQRLYRVRLNNPGKIVLDCPVSIDGKEYTCSYVELGNPGVPHAVVPMTNLKHIPEHALFDLGRKIRHYEAFQNGVNVNFYEITGPDRIYERTYERGVEDFTYACGTGTASMVTILTMRGEVSGQNVHVEMTGGELIIDVDITDNEVENIYLTGLTNMVAEGIITDEDLTL